MKRLLVIAFHFPPVGYSSGVHRTLKFVQYLRSQGWESIVLTVIPGAYPVTSEDQLAEVPNGMVVDRVFTLDAVRHLSIFGRYPGFLAHPDRWGSWQWFAIKHARRLIELYRPVAIFSTYPIASAHAIAGRVRSLTGLPWVADFRDSMVDAGYPSDPHQRRINIDLEQRVVSGCQRAVFTTQSTRAMYEARYPDLPSAHWSVIPNGYDEADFAALDSFRPTDALGDRKKTLLHSGILYPVERDPMPFLRALKALRDRGAIHPEDWRVRLRATAHDAHYAPILSSLGLSDLIELAPPLPYREALAEMASVDGLLLFQAENCNHQVPAKLYEYLRAQRPIVTLTHPDGDTAKVLRNVTADNLLPLDDEAALLSRLPAVLNALKEDRLKIAPMEQVRQFSREQGALDLARILNSVTV